MYTALANPTPEARYQQYKNHVQETLHQESVQFKERSLQINAKAEPLTKSLQQQLNTFRENGDDLNSRRRMLLEWCIQELEGEPSDSTSIHAVLTEEPKGKVEREDQKKPGYIVNAENNTRNFCHEALEEIKKGEGLSSITRKALLNRCIEEIYMGAPESEKVHMTLLSQSQFKTERNLEQDFQDQLAFVRSERKSLDSEQLALAVEPMTTDIQDRLDSIKHFTSELVELEPRYVQVIAKMHMSWTPFSKREGM